MSVDLQGNQGWLYKQGSSIAFFEKPPFRLILVKKQGLHYP